jgi:hypothetical protein
MNLMRPTAAVFVIMVALLSARTATDSQAAESAIEPPPIGEREIAISPQTQVWEGLYKADYSTRYHQTQSHKFATLSLAARITLTIVSLFLLVGGILHANWLKKRPTMANLLKWGSAAALGASIAFNFIPFGEWANKHAILAERWSGLMNQWRSVRMDVDRLDDAALLVKAQELLLAEKAIEAAEPPGPNEKVLLQSLDATDREFAVGKYEQPAAM